MGDRAAAINFYNQGVKIANDPTYPAHLTHSYQHFAAACYADPSYALAFYQTGNNNADLGYPEAAVACFRRALENGLPDKESNAKAWCNLGWMLHKTGKIEEAISCLKQAIEIDQTGSQQWCNLSVALRDVDESDESITCARKAFSIDPKDPLNEVALAFALLFGRELKEGYERFERRFEWRLHHFANYSMPRWKGEPNATVFLVADQGLGDTLSYARFVPMMAKKCRHIHMAVQSELIALFQHAFVKLPNVSIVPLQSQILPSDYWSTFVSLPFALGLETQQIIDCPGIDVPIFSLPKTWKVPDRKFHIGIAWAGSPMNDIDKYRNIPLTQFLELYRVPGVQLYSFQVDARSKDLQDHGCTPLIKDLSGYIRDVTATISLLQDIDLVITAESALGHICSAAGKECWIPYSYLGRDYRIGFHGTDNERMWAPKHRIFRQGRDATWGPVFERIVEALKDRAK